jgi:hypothetical protein
MDMGDTQEAVGAPGIVGEARHGPVLQEFERNSIASRGCE